MLKASKKALANNITKKTEDEEFKANYIKDMKDMTPSEISKRSEQVMVESQRRKYNVYLDKKLRATEWREGFFKAMYTTLENGTALSDGMVAALDKCMARDAEYEAKKDQPVDESKLPKITLKMRQWWIKENKLDSRVITGVILRETAKAYLIKGHADMVEATYCMRCGRELTEPASMVVGYGSECCEKLGIPYPADIKAASKRERQAIRKKLLKVLHNQTFECWVPKSQIEEVISSDGK